MRCHVRHSLRVARILPRRNHSAPRVRLPWQKRATERAARRANPFLRLDPRALSFDLVLPVANAGSDDFPHRCRNLECALGALPAGVHAVVVEQIVARDRPTVRSNTAVPEDLDHVWIEVEAPVFNKAWLYNIGARAAKSERLLFSEADVALEPHYWPHLARWIEATGYAWAIAWSELVYWGPDRVTKEETTRPKVGGPEGGAVFMDRDFFWSIGGYNEWMQQLGAEDNEIIRRAEAADPRTGLFPWVIDHLWHPASSLKVSPQREANRQLYREARDDPQAVIRRLRGFADRAGNPTAPLCAVP